VCVFQTIVYMNLNEAIFIDVRNIKIMCLQTWTSYKSLNMDKLQIWEEFKLAADLATWASPESGWGGISDASRLVKLMSLVLFA